jgi:hypothetical protein
MARRRFGRKAKRSMFRAKARRSRSTGGSNPIKLVLPAMAYGVGRQYLSNMATPLTSRLGFLGQYADEVLFGVAGWYIAKKNVFGLRKVGEAMLVVESASIGNQLAQKTLGNGSSGSSNITYYG